tara:strand:- start:1757 stop:2278 length:522 start_codon:yes stop_codon:yes gene_type:complete
MESLIEMKESTSWNSDKRKILSPLMSWDIFMNSYAKRMKHLKNLNDLKELNSQIKNVSCKIDFSAIQHTEYDAIVLTDLNQKILWINKGFTNMTGYSRNFVIGKRPHILQGKNTTQKSKESFRTNLILQKPFTQTILNYKKDRTIYICRAEVHPLKTNNGELKAFAAFEKEIL